MELVLVSVGKFTSQIIIVRRKFYIDILQNEIMNSPTFQLKN